MNKKCLVCGVSIPNIRSDGYKLYYKQYEKQKTCGDYCRGINSSKIKNTNEYIYINSKVSFLKIKDTNYKIDTEDTKILKKYVWYPTADNYLVNINKKRKPTCIYLHRYIMNCPDNMVIDHINRNKEDNSKNNLRITDYSMNAYNKTIPSSNKTSGVKGVSYSTREKSWRAEISYKKLGLNLCKRFKKKENAIQARKEMEVLLEYMQAVTADD